MATQVKVENIPTVTENGVTKIEDFLRKYSSSDTVSRADTILANNVTPIRQGNFVVAYRINGGRPIPTYDRNTPPPTVAEWNASNGIGNQSTSTLGSGSGPPNGGKYAGVTGPATYYQVNIPNETTSSPSPPSGPLTPQQQAELIEGLNILQVEELIPFLDPDLEILFDVTRTDEGILLYHNARAVDFEGATNMNFPTAENHSRLNGTPIARTSWVDADGNFTKWMVYEKGVFILYTAEERRVVKNTDLVEGDYLATNWRFPPACSESAELKPSIKVNANNASTPTFDIQNPPCKVT